MRFRYLIILILIPIAIGCSRSPIAPDSVPGVTGLAQQASGHICWGKWSIQIDPENGIASATPMRDSSAHVDVTWFLEPPQCPDCLQIIITGFDPVERIADITMVLRNPTEFTGYDVKAIISNYGLKEFLEPDAYADFYTDGTTWDPYYIFAEDEEDHEFGPDESHAIGFQLRFPPGSSTNATVTVDASWPGPQDEPWRIGNIIVAGPLQNNNYNHISFTCHVWDHQDDVPFVQCDLRPVGPDNVPMGDDSLHMDYKAGDGIWGLSGIVTRADPGEYDIWVRARTTGSDHLVCQRVMLEVIDPVYPQPPLYIVSMMHAEEQEMYLNESTYLGYSETLRDLMQVFDNHGAKIAFQPDWTFIQGTMMYDPTLFADMQARGHGVDTHAHETQYDLGQVHDMLDDAGVTDTIICNGGFQQRWGDDGNWAAYVAHFTTTGGQQMFRASVAYKHAPTQTVDGLRTPIRPSTTGDWMVHDPEGPIVYISGTSIAHMVGSEPDFFSLLPDAVDYAIAGVIPDKINVFYWHDPAGLYDGSPLSQTRLDFWDQVLGDYFDRKVADGDLIWANFNEIYQLYLDWEATHGG